MDERVTNVLKFELKNGRVPRVTSVENGNYLGTVGGKGGISEDRLRY